MQGINAASDDMNQRRVTIGKARRTGSAMQANHADGVRAYSIERKDKLVECGRNAVLAIDQRLSPGIVADDIVSRAGTVAHERTNHFQFKPLLHRHKMRAHRDLLLFSAFPASLNE